VLDPTNAHHDAARAALRPLAGMPKLIHPINLAEVLVGAVQRAVIDETQDVLRRAGIGSFTPGTGEPLALARARVLTGLKMPDTCAYVTARSRGLPLVTFDRRLTIAARAAGVDVLGAPPEWQP
jgi:predicted nucleic acid-binding protein